MPKNAREKELARAARKREQEKQTTKRKKTAARAVVAIVVIAVVVVAATLLVGRDGTKTKTQATGAPPMTIDTSKTYTAVLDTSFGSMKIALSPKTAPTTVNNFVYLANEHKYDGVLFHRVSNSLSVIQGGDVTCKTPSASCGQGGPGYKFADELTGQEKYTQGVVAMANSGPNTNGSQFFIVTGDKATQLPASYTIFGKLADPASLKVAQTIQSQPVKGETPVTPIVINSVKIEESG